jgi:hypothetical protein
MLHYQAAHAIAHPHEQAAIEAVLTDMANTTNSTPGTAANMGDMRTAVGALKRLKGTEAFAQSLSAVRAPIERKIVGDRGTADYDEWSDSAKERFDDRMFDVSQEEILGRRKKN